ncbi:MAG: helix-hairpin-helix domain-containing protein [candidate division Zixibacteria bacterium]|nr:helix-hairpin-helix domain-containing protein [candidate division Zixibacteria bacterium]
MMISQICGRIKHLTEESVTLELNGLCYELMIPSGLYARLKEAQFESSEILLHTLNYIEAGDKKSYHYPRLVGFTDPIDKEFFQLFTTVSGLGVKKALKSLTLPIREIATAIETKDAATLSRLPGIGGRLADKAIAELYGKMARFALAKGEQPLTSVHKGKENFVTETIEILLQLQYKRNEAEKMIDNALKINPKIDSAEKLVSAIFTQEAMARKGIQP